ncbi:hypothetical protein I7I48_03959 [Histoplasma ohiense]|nr:hypothetical protein I7I48_03959 [Histoplasma ohiense (nom. inval.)]
MDIDSKITVVSQTSWTAVPPQITNQIWAPGGSLVPHPHCIPAPSPSTSPNNAFLRNRRQCLRTK